MSQVRSLERTHLQVKLCAPFDKHTLVYSSSLCFFTLLEIQILLPIILESPSVISSFPFLLLMIVLFGFPGGSVLNNLPAMQEM